MRVLNKYLFRTPGLGKFPHGNYRKKFNSIQGERCDGQWERKHEQNCKLMIAKANWINSFIPSAIH